jgi:hypothetical protein
VLPAVLLNESPLPSPLLSSEDLRCANNGGRRSGCRSSCLSCDRPRWASPSDVAAKLGASCGWPMSTLPEDKVLPLPTDELPRGCPAHRRLGPFRLSGPPPL